MAVPGVGAGFSARGGSWLWATKSEEAPAAPRRGYTGAEPRRRAVDLDDGWARRGRKAGGVRGSRHDPASRENGRSRARLGGGPWAARGLRSSRGRITTPPGTDRKSVG